MYRIARLALSRGNGLKLSSPLSATQSLNAISSQRQFTVSSSNGAKEIR